MGKRDPEVERAILEAAERLLTGKAVRVTGRNLSATELADEAGIHRSRLYRHYADLKDAFLAQVQEQVMGPDPLTPRERNLLDEIRDLKDRIAYLEAGKRDEKQSRSQWKEAAEAAFRIVNLLEKEAHLMRVDLGSKDAEIERLREVINGRMGAADVSTRPEFTVISGKPGEPGGTA